MSTSVGGRRETVATALIPGEFHELVMEADGSVRVAISALPPVVVGPVTIAGPFPLPTITVAGSVTAATIVAPLPLPTDPVDRAGRLLGIVTTPQLPAALVGGRLDTNLGAWLGSTAPTVGQKVMADSVPVVLASDQPAISVTVSGGSVADTTQPTFIAVFDRIVPAAGKYMATLFNELGSGRKVVLQRIWTYNWQITPAVGMELDEELRFITARTAGAAITITPEWSIDVLSAGITADTGSTVVTDGALIKRIICSNDNVMAADNKTLVEQRTVAAIALDYERKLGTRGLTLLPGQGITVKNITASVSGSVSYVFEFTDEV